MNIDILILSLAIPLVGFGYREFRKKKEKRKPSHAVAALALGLGGIAWLFFRNWQNAYAMMDSRTWAFLGCGLILAATGLFWLRGPKKERHYGYAALFLAAALGCFAFALGLFGLALWTSLPAIKTLLLGS